MNMKNTKTNIINKKEKGIKIITPKIKKKQKNENIKIINKK